MRTGRNNLITDVAGFIVGNAKDHRIKTGSTVFLADQPFTAAVQVMGGAPGTRETDLLAPDKMVQKVNALVLSGGSSFGLDAASGVMDALAKRGTGFQIGNVVVPIVPGAILFDLANGGDKDWVENPYKKLGAEALEKADQTFGLGSVGAGYGATIARHKGGLGSASLILPNGITVGALVAVNALGSAVDSKGYFHAAPFEIGAEFGGLGPSATPDPVAHTFTNKATNPKGNTTIAIVATDADLTQAQAHRVAVAAHDGMARALYPAHTPFDGDLVFAASSNRIPLAKGDLDLMHIGHAASVCLSRAIARGVWLAEPQPDDLFPCVRG